MVKIIGAGPCGSYAGMHLARQGFDVEIFEEHAEIGKPVQCTGIVTSKLKEMVRFENNYLVNRIKKAMVFSPNGNSAEFPVDDMVIDRARFDRQLAEMAEAEGAKIHLGKKADLSMVSIAKAVAKKEGVIGADGPQGMLFETVNPGLKRRFLSARQAIVKGDFHADMFEVHLGSVAPGFFAWVVPESAKKARIGLAVQKDPGRHFQDFLKKLDIKKEQVLEDGGGLIPVFDPDAKVQHKNIYLLGDSCGQVKATTGGGIVPGLTCARSLAGCIKDGRSYQEGYGNTVKKDLMAHHRARKILDKFSDGDYDKLVGMLSEPGARKAFEKHSRDEPFMLMSSLLLRKPGMLRFLGKLL